MMINYYPIVWLYNGLINFQKKLYIMDGQRLLMRILFFLRCLKFDQNQKVYIR